MAKNKGDIILRDRMEFTLDENGDLTTVYGRIDLSAYVNVQKKAGLAVKQIFFHVREQASTALANTGIWDPVADYQDANGNTSALKIVACTRAYEFMKDIGIASPDVLCIQEYTSTTSPDDGDANAGTSYWNTDRYFGPTDMHPEGYTLVSDLLIGVAVDNWERNADMTLELDVLLIAEPVSVSQERVDALLTQAQDL